MRVVHGVPTSWDPAIATIKLPSHTWNPAWSPCSRFIAVPSYTGKGIYIFDAVTLKQLKSLEYPGGNPQFVAFSPDSCTLVCIGQSLVCWDLQTGVPIYNFSIDREFAVFPCSITYSKCGKMLGVLSNCSKIGDHQFFVLSIYDVLTGTPINYHPIEGLAANTIWTYDDSIQFATLDVQSITIWQVGFVSNHLPAEVRSMPTPDNFDPWKGFLFLPTPPRLAFNYEKSLFVWDDCQSKFLLDHEGSRKVAFSHGGHFFASVTQIGEINLWKESPAGYIPHQRLVSGIPLNGELLLSPDGQSVIMHDSLTLQLLRTTGLGAPHSSTPTQPVNWDKHFILGLSQDGSLAVVSRLEDNVATVLNLKSGLPSFIIDTGMPVYGLGIARGTVAVVGNGKVITWNLPTRDCALNHRVNINDSVQTTFFQQHDSLESASISPDLSYIAIKITDLRIYDGSTGKLLTGSKAQLHSPCFTSDGHEVWSRNPHCRKGLVIVRDSKSNVINLRHATQSGDPSGRLPWQSPHGYQVTDDGWILSTSGKQLLWLPHHWRSDEKDRVWGGQFLALLHRELSEVVILELPEEE